MKNNSGKIYFASDFHLGAPDKISSLRREEIIVNWLFESAKDAAEIILLGDIFDFWFEYKTVIPKGFTRLLGALASISDRGIKLRIVTGNHDLWMKNYFIDEIKAEIHRDPVFITYSDKKFYLAHGDGLGPGDYGYKFINKIFKSRICQWLFCWLHPDIGISFANFCSKLSRSADSKHNNIFLGEKEWLIIHSRSILQNDNKIDYMIYGHRHYPVMYNLNENTKYVNLGDMISHFSYAVFDGNELTLQTINS